MTNRFFTSLLLSVVLFSANATADEPEQRTRTFTFAAEGGQYFFPRSFYHDNDQPFATRSITTPSLTFTIGLSPRISLLMRLGHLWVREGRTLPPQYWVGSGGTNDRTYKATYEEYVSILAAAYHVPLSSWLGTHIYAGPAFGYIKEETKASPYVMGFGSYSYAFGTVGVGLGLELEANWVETPMSVFLRLEGNIKHRTGQALFQDHGGALIGLGVRYSFKAE